MFNPKNNCMIIGRVAQETKVFTRADGSKSLIGKVAVDDNYKTGGEYQTEFVEFTKFVPAGQEDFAERMKVGDDVIVTGHLTCKPYEKDGEKVYPALSFAADKVTPNGRGRRKSAGQEMADAELPAEEEVEA